MQTQAGQAASHKITAILNDPDQISRELLDDFFIEADDHLAQIRENLVQLEASIGRAQLDRVTLQSLFREFHSLKGISAIVGLKAAEKLAHATEDYLRELTRGSVTLSKEGLDTLMAAAQSLEQIVGAFRSNETPRENAPVYAALKALVGASVERGSDAVEAPPKAIPRGGNEFQENAQEKGLILWHCVFTPSRELDARGININSIRERLLRHGEIFKATPLILGPGQIAFDFIAGMRETPPDFTSWEADGLTSELIEHPVETSSVEPELENIGIAQQHDPFLAPSHVVRVTLQRLDDLMQITGEMIVQRTRLDDEITSRRRKGKDQSSGNLQAFEEINHAMMRGLRDLRSAITRVRLVSVAEIFARMPFVIRDLVRESGKKARLKIEGQQTEIDKFLIERLKDPLLHLVRNCFSHGVEPVAERQAAGKADEATITLSAATQGDMVVITISDDGRGIDREFVRKRAEASGLEPAVPFDNSELLRILCSQGFTTRDEADRASGRGIGMAVVLTTLNELGGTLGVESRKGEGTCFTLRLPLTLAISETIIISAAKQTCAVPQNLVSEIIHIQEKDIRRVNGVEVIPYRAGLLPLRRLTDFFKFPAGSSSQAVLVLNSDRGSSGLVVEQVHGLKEVVVRAIRDPLIKTPGVSGATELGNGKPVLILDASVFTSGAVRPNQQGSTRNFYATGN